MKITLDNIYYKGHYIKKFECEMPNIKNLDEIPEEKIITYVIEILDEFLKENEA